MHLHSRISALVVLLFVSWLVPASAHSAPARPLKRLAHPSTLALEILPRQQSSSLFPNHSRRYATLDPSTLRYDDFFRLTIAAFDDVFYLHLRPNDHLIHPAARVNYHTVSPDGRSTVSHSEPLLRESVRAYWGEVITSDHSPTRMREDAARVVPTPHPAELGWARIMVHHQGNIEGGIAPEFEGAFSVNGVIYHIMTKDNYLRTKDPLDPDVSQPLDGFDSNLVIWRESDVMTLDEEHFARTGEQSARPVVAQTCGHDNLPFNTDPAQNAILGPSVSTNWINHALGPFGNTSIYRRDDVVTGGGGMGTNFINNIGQNAGCPASQKILYMGVAADCEFTTKFGSSENATRQILTDWNSASTLYKSTFNVSLGIVELQVQDSICPTPVNSAIPWNVPCSAAVLEDRLNLFSQWRGDKGDDGIGLWHLMSGCPTGSEVGIAWLATLCQKTITGGAGQTVSGTAVSTSGRTEWQVIAHEIGHNFGAIHDCADGCTSTSSCCPLSTGTCNADAKFIMSPVAQSGIQNFSPCSLGNICSLMTGNGAGGKIDNSCLVDPDPNRQIVSLQMCGNGIVEKGEDCDPGKDLESPCCDSSTCKFKGNAVCDPDSSQCCTQQCTFAPSTKVCRPSKDANCDTAEMCTGNSSSCPADIVAPNGKSCGSNNLKCASGQCTSVAQQCQAIGGSMNLTDACPNSGASNTCQVSCKDPRSANTCVLLSSMLIDGSPCGYGGFCAAGKCQTGNFLDTAKAWYTENLQIAIPVTVVAGIVALLLLWALIRGLSRCCARRRKPPGNPILGPDPVIGGLRHERLVSYDDRNGYDRAAGLRAGPMVPPFMQSQQVSYSPVPRDMQGYTQSHWQAPPPQHWVDDSAYNGPRH